MKDMILKPSKGRDMNQSPHLYNIHNDKEQ